jgi:EAL domain-containing protein (putative c-di-GMP-specific phosphodiesterase class I)
VRLALDDFGNWNSPLAYLRQAPRQVANDRPIRR